MMVLVVPTFFMTMSCNVVRKAESSVEVATVSTNNAADVELRTSIIGWAKNFVGSSYRSSGTSPRKGFDCSGFTSYILKEYGFRIAPGSSSQAKLGKAVSLENAQPGDLVFFGNKKRINHVALVVSNNNGDITVVHSTNSRGVVVENVNDSDYWRKRVLFARDVVSTKTNHKKNS